jgi:hypothetical protein
VQAPLLGHKSGTAGSDTQRFTATSWYAKTFGGTAGTHNNAAVVDGILGVQIRFAKADTA